MFRRTQMKPQAPTLENRQKAPNYFLLICLIGFATIVSIAVYGFTGLMSRYDASQASASMDSPVQGVIGHFCRYITILSFCLIIMHKRPKGLIYWVALGIAAAASFLTDDPISVPRFLAGTLGLAVLTTFLRRKRISGIWMPIVLIGGLIAVMPVLNLARRTSLSQINWSTYSPTDVTTTMTDGDFDAYQMLCDTIHMPADQITWGNQLYGNLLFFVPRSIWTSKPLSSGNLVGDYYELSYVNFSEPLPAEGYINFGVPGVILFAIICGMLFGWADAAYWRQMDTRPDTIGPTWLQLLYVFMVGLVIYTMRGALLAAIPDIAAFVAGAWLVVRVAYPDLLMRRRKALSPYGERVPAIDEDSGLLLIGGDHRN
jgi:oligosaccharide repeat unit polymerase